MEIHVIYDMRPIPDKLSALMAEFSRQGIQPTKIWEPIEAKTVVESINATHKAIIRYAQENKLKEVCIIEDDCCFPAEDGWQRFLANKPKDYSVYIGGTYLVHEPEKWQPPLIKVDAWVGNHCIIVSEAYYDRFLGVSDKEHIDTAQSGLGDFYCVFPFVALQRPGFSSNAMQQVNYNSLLKPEWIYGTLHSF